MTQRYKAAPNNKKIELPLTPNSHKHMSFLNKYIKNIWLRNILAVAAIFLIFIILINIFLNLITRHNREFDVPDFSNMTVQEASLLAKNHNIRIDVTDSVYIRGLGRGLISKQTPQPGEKVKKNRRILLTINAVNPKFVAMPYTVGFSLRQAKTEILASGLTIGKLIYVQDIATNNVLDQQINGNTISAGTQVESYSSIDLVLGKNDNYSTTYIPNVVGYKYEIAKDLLFDNSLNIGKIVFDNTVITQSDSTDAYVIKQMPISSDSIKVDLGTYVRLYLSKDLSKIEQLHND